MDVDIKAIPAYVGLMISAKQIRAGRAMVGWTQDRLAEVAGLSLAVVNNVERGVTDSRRSTLERIQSALESAGVEFLSPHQTSLSGGEGVRVRPPTAPERG